MTGNDPLNDPENFDWEGWENEQIADFERKQRVTETVRNRISWRGVNERGAVSGAYQAGENAYAIEIARPPADGTRSDRRLVLINGQKVGRLPGVRAAANLAIKHFVDRSDLSLPHSSPAAQNRPQMSETSEGEVMLNTRAIDQDRLDRVLERLADRRDRVDGDYYDLFNDRWLEARRWKADLATGSGVLTLDRRNSLLEFERIADPGAQQSPLSHQRHGRQGAPSADIFAHCGGGRRLRSGGDRRNDRDSSIFAISEQSWNTREAAEQALQRDAWTIKEPAHQARRAR